MESILMNELLLDASTELKKLRPMAWKYKIAFIGLMLMGGSYGAFEVLHQLQKLNFNLMQMELFCAGSILVMSIPFVLSPLYSFLPQRYLDTINNVIKRKLIFNELKNFHCKFDLHPASYLSEDILARTGILKNDLNFVYGDDMFIGECNGFEVKFSEYHVTKVFFTVFNGLVAVVHKAGPKEDFLLVNDSYRKHCKPLSDQGVSTSVLASFRQNNDLLFVKYQQSKYYIGVKGRRKMFEYSFKDIESNKGGYDADISSLHSLLNFIDVVTREHL